VLGGDHDVTLMTAEAVAMARRRQGRLAEARPLLVEAFDARRRLHGMRHPYTIEDAMKLGLVLLDLREYAQAEATVRPVASDEGPSAEPWLVYEAKSVLGGALAGLGRTEEAERELLKAHDGLIALGTRIPAQEKPMIRETVDRLVTLYRAIGNEARAAFWAARQSPR
jgi:hypothetical protein